MTKHAKEILTQLTSVDAKGPFVTIMLNTHVTHQAVEKDQIKLKNFAKEAKRRFEKRYVSKSWGVFQEKIDTLLADKNFWRSPTESVAIILTEQDTYIYRLSIPVDDQYYVSETPYLLAIIKNMQFHYNFYILALNRSEMKLYLVEHKQVKVIDLPEGAPVDLETALGTELTDSGLNYSRGDSGAYHGTNTKDEAIEIDWVNYYQAIDTYFRNSFDGLKDYPVYFIGLSENLTVMKKVAKNPLFKFEPAVTKSPAQFGIKEVAEAASVLANQLAERDTAGYDKLLDKKNIDQLVDIIPAAKEGRISHFFLASSNLIDGFGEDPETEYDRRQVLNTIADDVIGTGGDVFLLEQEKIPGEKSLVAVLRY